MRGKLVLGGGSRWLPLSSAEAWLCTKAFPDRNFLILAVSLGLLAGLLLIIQAGVLAGIVHQVIFDGKGLRDVILPLGLLPMTIILRALLVWSAEHFGFKAAAAVKTALRIQLFDHFFALGPQRLRSRATGDLAHQVVDAVEGLEAYYARFLPQAAQAALLPLAMLAFILPLDLVSGLVLLFTAPFIPLFMVLIGNRAEKMNRRQWRKLAALSARFLDSLQGLTTLKMFNASRRETEVIARITEDYRKTTVSVMRVAFLSALMLEFLATVSVAVVAVFIGFKLLSGSITFQAGFFILLLAPEFYLPLRTLGAHYHSRLAALAAAEGIIAIMSEPPQRQTPGNNRFSWPLVNLDLENISFSHIHGQALLQYLNVRIPAGSITVLAGPSGAGKTTLLRILLRSITPDTGRLLVNGTDLREVSFQDWLTHVVWMPQEPYFFQGTMQDNMLMGAAIDVSQDQWSGLKRAAAMTGLDQDLANLPAGLQTTLGEGGFGLSGGQRQRLALTRAFFKDAPLFLLDEPTAHLDEQSCQTVLAALRSLGGRRTLVVASHDPRVREIADIVVELRTDKDYP